MGKRGAHDQNLACGWEGLRVAEEQNDLQEVSFLVDRERFLLPGHKGWRSLGGDAEHVRKSRGSDVLELALEEGVEPKEGVVRRG